MSVSTELKKILETIDGSYRDQLNAIKAEESEHHTFQTDVTNFIRLEKQNQNCLQATETQAHEEFQQLLMKPASSQGAQRLMDVLQYQDRAIAPVTRNVQFLVKNDSSVLSHFPERYVFNNKQLVKLTAQYTGSLFGNAAPETKEAVANPEQTIMLTR